MKKRKDAAVLEREPEAEVMSERSLIELMLDEADKREKFYGGIKPRVLKQLRLGDVIACEGRPYITAPGASKIATLFGVRTSCGGRAPERSDHEDQRGKYYIYKHVVTASLPNGDSREAVGVCTSRDKFFGFAHGQYKPVEDVYEENICLASATVAERRAIVRLLGLENLTWDDLAQYGIKQSEVTAFSFTKPARTTPAGRRSDAGTDADQHTAAPLAAKPSGHSGQESGRNAAPPQADSDGTRSGSSPATKSDEPNARTETFNLLKQIQSHSKGKQLSEIIREYTGGKQSLGQLSDEEVDEVRNRAADRLAQLES